MTRIQKQRTRYIPEHGCDQLPGEREDTDPDAGDGDSLQKLVKLVVCECCKCQMNTKSNEVPIFPNVSWKLKQSYRPVRDETLFLAESTCRSKQIIVPKIMRVQTSSSAKRESHSNSLESMERKRK